MKYMNVRWYCLASLCEFDRSADLKSPDGTSTKEMLAKANESYRADKKSSEHRKLKHDVRRTYKVAEYPL